jgi:hypothetical protein
MLIKLSTGNTAATTTRGVVNIEGIRPTVIDSMSRKAWKSYTGKTKIGRKLGFSKGNGVRSVSNQLPSVGRLTVFLKNF